jgi:homoserine dehydrogenase
MNAEKPFSSPIAPRPIVLKLGSSVLPTAEHRPRVVSEIYRHHRAGRPVVAVVSAFKGRTDALARQAAAFDAAPDSHAHAAVLAVGELEASAMLAVALERAGLDAVLLSVREIALRTTGPATDAMPVSVDPAPMRRELAAGRVVVLPGFMGTDADGRQVVLGRGGTDIAAIAIGHALDAEICLMKDVCAVYEWAPTEQGPAPRAFDHLHWDDAIALTDRVIQRKAIEFARDHTLDFRVACLGSDAGTAVGRAPTTFAPSCAEDHRPLRVAIAGLGSVGLGVAQRLALEPDRFAPVAALVRDANRERPGLPESCVVSVNPDDLFASEPDILVELIGGTGLARELIARALARGISVVTANKAVLAADGPALRALASEHGAQLLYSASVAGSVPALELLRTVRAPVRRVRGVLNGTSNYILNALSAGRSFDDALADAKRLGYAEADPSRDIHGLDAADKLAVLALEASNWSAPPINPDAVPRDHLDARTPERLVAGARLRQVATLDLSSALPSASVRIEAVHPGDPLFDLPGAWNAIVFELGDGSSLSAHGSGAGRWPTTESVVADLLDLSHTLVPTAARGGRPDPYRAH